MPKVSYRLSGLAEDKKKNMEGGIDEQNSVA